MNLKLAVSTLQKFQKSNHRITREVYSLDEMKSIQDAIVILRAIIREEEQEEYEGSR
jgi:hypothetical protein